MMCFVLLAGLLLLASPSTTALSCTSFPDSNAFETLVAVPSATLGPCRFVNVNFTFRLAPGASLVLDRITLDGGSLTIAAPTSGSPLQDASVMVLSSRIRATTGPAVGAVLVSNVQANNFTVQNFSMTAMDSVLSCTTLDAHALALGVSLNTSLLPDGVNVFVTATDVSLHLINTTVSVISTRKSGIVNVAVAGFTVAWDASGTGVGVNTNVTRFQSSVANVTSIAIAALVQANGPRTSPVAIAVGGFAAAFSADLAVVETIRIEDFNSVVHTVDNITIACYGQAKRIATAVGGVAVAVDDSISGQNSVYQTYLIATNVTAVVSNVGLTTQSATSDGSVAVAVGGLAITRGVFLRFLGGVAFVMTAADVVIAANASIWTAQSSSLCAVAAGGLAVAAVNSPSLNGLFLPPNAVLWTSHSEVAVTSFGFIRNVATGNRAATAVGVAGIAIGDAIGATVSTDTGTFLGALSCNISIANSAARNFTALAASAVAGVAVAAFGSTTLLYCRNSTTLLLSGSNVTVRNYAESTGSGYYGFSAAAVAAIAVAFASDTSHITVTNTTILVDDSSVTAMSSSGSDTYFVSDVVAIGALVISTGSSAQVSFTEGSGIYMFSSECVAITHAATPTEGDDNVAVATAVVAGVAVGFSRSNNALHTDPSTLIKLFKSDLAANASVDLTTHGLPIAIVGATFYETAPFALINASDTHFHACVTPFGQASGHTPTAVSFNTSSSSTVGAACEAVWAPPTATGMSLPNVTTPTAVVPWIDAARFLVSSGNSGRPKTQTRSRMTRTMSRSPSTSPSPFKTRTPTLSVSRRTQSPTASLTTTSSMSSKTSHTSSGTWSASTGRTASATHSNATRQTNQTTAPPTNAPRPTNVTVPPPPPAPPRRRTKSRSRSAERSASRTSTLSQTSLTETTSASSSLLHVPAVPPPAVISVVTTSAQTTASSVASVVAVASVSNPGAGPSAGRISALMLILQCDSSSDGAPEDPLPIAAHPLSFSLPQAGAVVRYSAASVLGNLAVALLVVALHAGVAGLRFGCTHCDTYFDAVVWARLPGFSFQLHAYILALVMQASAACLLRGNVAGGFIGVLGALLCLIVLGILTFFTVKKVPFTDDVMPWVSPRLLWRTWSEDQLTGCFGAFFEDYTHRARWWMSVEIGVSLASSIFAGLGQTVTCAAAAWAGVVPPLLYVLLLVAVRPHQRLLDFAACLLSGLLLLVGSAAAAISTVVSDSSTPIAVATWCGVVSSIVLLVPLATTPYRLARQVAARTLRRQRQRNLNSVAQERLLELQEKQAELVEIPADPSPPHLDALGEGRVSDPGVAPVLLAHNDDGAHPLLDVPITTSRVSSSGAQRRSTFHAPASSHHAVGPSDNDVLAALLADDFDPRLL